MSISGDYPHPVNVNGYSCKNCTDVDYAKKHIDPAHPKSGPYGVTASSDPSAARETFIKLSGKLKAETAHDGQDAVYGPLAAQSVASTAQASAPGQSLNILA